MDNVLSRISSYNLFNYFFPGIVFVFLVKQFTAYNLLQGNLIVDAFVYYFVGMVVSRFGSLVIEPLLRISKFVVFTDYKDFVRASGRDKKIDLLSEVNNTYRTLISAALLLLLLKLYSIVESYIPDLEKWRILILAVSIFVLFLFSYRKQTEYIAKRVDAQRPTGSTRARKN